MTGCPFSGAALAQQRAAGPPGPISFAQICDVMPIGAMTCDLTTFTIDYANPSSIELLHSIRDTLGIDPDAIIGTSIDIFHKNPAYQRDLLSEPGNLPYKARIRFGDEWLDLSIHALPEPGGRVSRALLVWSIATAEVLKEQEEYRLPRMIDDVPVAVMTVDPATYRITYVNETSKRTLGQIETHLPIKAADLLGGDREPRHTGPGRPNGSLISVPEDPFRNR